MKDLNIFLPFDSITKSKKSEKDGKDYVTVAGYASTPALDFQGEKIDPIGLDPSYLINNGYVDYEHNSDIVIGVPTENSYVDPEKGLFLEANLFTDMPEVQDIIKLNNNLKKTDAKRKLGFSIEGQVQKRNDANPNIIESVLVTGVAVTKNPANPEATWSMIQKSNAMEAGHGISPDTQRGGAALRTESFSNKLVNLASAMHRLKNSGLPISEVAKNVAQSLDERGVDDKLVTQLFLQIFAGNSSAEAEGIINSISNADVKEATKFDDSQTKDGDDNLAEDPD